MVKRGSFLISVLFAFLFCTGGGANDSEPGEFRPILEQQAKALQKLAGSKDIVFAVKKQNVESLSEDEVIRRDRIWLGGDDDVRRAMLDEKTSRLLEKIISKRRAVYSELILVDKSGANIAAYPLPSDYWQGDEEKFIQPYTRARTYYGPLEFDESSEMKAMQVSVPVYDSDKVIGVLIGGVRLSYAEARSYGVRPPASDDD